MLEIQYIFASIILTKWFSILREPGELFSFYDRALIGLDETRPILHKILTCSICHSGYLAMFSILYFGAHFMILPTTMVLYYLLSKIKFQ